MGKIFLNSEPLSNLKLIESARPDQGRSQQWCSALH